MDRRITPANHRVAASHLQGKIQAERYLDGVLRQVAGAPFLLREPNGARDRQLLWGDRFRVFETGNDWSFGQSEKDGYVGYLHHDLSEVQECTHRVTMRTTWVYPVAGFKEPALLGLHFNSSVQVAEIDKNWAKIRLTRGDGDSRDAFVPISHLRPIHELEDDPVDVASRFLGTPYVWAGNSGHGIDCSGLVQAVLLSCGIPCPGDSDMQEAEVGETLGEGETPMAGDLFFWRGHVAMAVDEDILIHANAHHMAVTYEGIKAAVQRIEAQGDGPVTRRARPDWSHR